MMNAIVPMNITAIRVNVNDESNVVSQFKGRTAVFERMPFGSSATTASTGDMVVAPLSNSSPPNPLGTGIHLHWELPDYFRRGRQPALGGDVVFPQTPNRWLVIRYLSVYDATSGDYESVQQKCWIVESDYLAGDLTPDPDGFMHPAASVPLPANLPQGTQPYMYMGRVVEYESWVPGSTPAQNYLPAYQGSDGKSLYLTAIGFVGPSFSSYYPECCSVFGFWDRFADNPAVYPAITTGTALQFKVSYQVVGWIDEPDADPLAQIESLITDRYNQYVSQCQAESAEVERTPADEFESFAKQNFRWTFHEQDIPFTLHADKSLATLTVPQRMLCAGIMQEIVWNMLTAPGTTYFLNNPANTNATALWTDTVKLAVGNTTVEALSVLLKKDLDPTTTDPALLNNYEYLLDALQLGLLHDLEQQGNNLIGLEESCHSKAFSQLSGGYLWVLRKKQMESNPSGDADQEVTLPLDVAEHLYLLNQAQKNYDQGRARLDAMRKQLFMDWVRYIKIYISGMTDPFVDTDVLMNFLQTGNSGELNDVVQYGQSVGILLYQQDPITSEIVGIRQPAGDSSLAALIWFQHQAMSATLAPYLDWEIRAIPAPPFWMPTDPVLIMEGDRLEPVRRNGSDPDIAVRLSGELLAGLQLQYQNTTFNINATDISGMPVISDATPMQQDVKSLVVEAFMLVPMLATAAANALKSKGGTVNPAVSNYDDFVASLRSAQGGLSQLEDRTATGLFAAVRAPGYIPAANPTQTVSTPMPISVSYTNDAANGWAPDAVAWNTQTALPEFDDTRYDPFLPVFMIWTAQLDPLKRNDGLNYTVSNLTDYFTLDADAVDFQYQTPDTFTTAMPVSYSRSVTLSKNATHSLTQQIDNYVANYHTDQDTDAKLEAAKQIYKSRKFISQGLSGFNIEQTLRTFIPQVPVEDLIKGVRDRFTTAVNHEAVATPDDNWYDFGFNSQAPIATGLLAQDNFGPLRSGFVEIFQLEIVDVFGQRMTLNTSAPNPDGSLQAGVAYSLQPARGDSDNQHKIFLPPRLLAPTRLAFDWLSATHDNKVGGVSSDFVEMNTHPSTSPVCGWVFPNHLDDNLFFYDADGAAIGSFGVEHGELKYRTRPGNLNNPQDLLEDDIGPENGPHTVNAHLATFMWYVNGKDAGFLFDLMATIENSDQYINPVNFAQDVSPAVLVGRPLALARAAVGLETSGKVLPLNQADTKSDDPFPLDVENNRFQYAARQEASSAALEEVRFPLRLGDLSNIDDGLVGYLVERAGDVPDEMFYSPAAPAEGGHGVVRPSRETIDLTLNAPPVVVTMLIDPRAPVHATTGILPVQTRQIPPDQYARTMRSLAITFFTHPMLRRREEFVVPLPQESGYQWSWVTPGSDTQSTLKAATANEFVVFGYTPQTLVEGWLRLGREEEEAS
jgi:hypothetical protein